MREEQIAVTSFALIAPLPAGSYRIWVRAVSGNMLAPWSLKFDTDIV